MGTLGSFRACFLPYIADTRVKVSAIGDQSLVTQISGSHGLVRKEGLREAKYYHQTPARSKFVQQPRKVFH